MRISDHIALTSAAIASLAALPAVAAADVVAQDVVIVGRAAPGAAWTDAPTEARIGDDPELAVVVVARDGRARVYVADPDIAPLRVDNRVVPAKRRRGWDALPDAAVRWSTVEPHAWREADVVAPNGTTTRFHTNVSTEAATFGRWLGYDAITYFETPLGDWAEGAGARRRAASAHPPRAADDVFGGLGTMRYKVEVRVRDRVRDRVRGRDAAGRDAAGDSAILASPGADAVDRAGILPAVHRVSIRRDDTFLGFLTAYFMVPEVFGSAGSGRNHQTDRYVGADCADVLTGALRASGRRDVRHTNVASLTSYARVIVEPTSLDDDGNPPAAIEGVQPGDIIRIDYGGSLTGHTPRAWDHVAVLVEDRSDPEGPARGRANGRLDGFDRVVHMGHPRLVIEPLASQAPATIDVLRWRPSRRR